MFTTALVARHSDKLVSVTAAGTQDGAEVVQWTDKGKPNQQFRLG
ncbi:RICIN domain-containing protein [Streptomyces sp. NBC_00555]|nr:RICIN domain-containing protein [Streptomyces sp. NBC_00555]